MRGVLGAAEAAAAGVLMPGQESTSALKVQSLRFHRDSLIGYAERMPQPTVGRRERKKAQTRRSLSEAAMTLFLERGFDVVTVAEVADAADVAVSTLFKHFPCKEALVFDEDDAIEAGLVRAIAERPAGTSILHALRDAMRETPDGGPAGPTPELVTLVDRTPALRIYLDQMWSRYADAIAAAIAADTGADPGDVDVRAIARYVVLVPSIARHDPDPATAITRIFDRLEHGWGTVLP
jgi:AcrR family transcriptional regulator